jgi:hypothetical protein
MSAERHLAAIASLALLITMFFPWYQQNAVVSAAKAQALQSRNLNAFQVFSFVEAAVLLVAVAVSYMLFARAEGRDFNLPGGDGMVVLAAGLWAALLLVLRLFDKPGITSHGVAANVGVQWGIFFALGAAGMLAYAGQRMRPHHHQPVRHRPRAPEPQPAPAADEPATVVETEAPPRREPRPRYPAPPATAAARAGERTERARLGGSPEQLSFEEEPPTQADG